MRFDFTLKPNQTKIVDTQDLPPGEVIQTSSGQIYIVARAGDLTAAANQKPRYLVNLFTGSMIYGGRVEVLSYPRDVEVKLVRSEEDSKGRAD